MSKFMANVTFRNHPSLGRIMMAKIEVPATLPEQLILLRELSRKHERVIVEKSPAFSFFVGKPKCFCCPETTNLTECQAIPGSVYHLCPYHLRDEEDES